MALILNNRVLFIHNPKTGGTFIRSAIKNLNIPYSESGIFIIEEHWTAQKVKEFYPMFYDMVQNRCFVFIRNPLDWLASRWAWGIETGIMDKINRNELAAKRHRVLGKNMSLDFNEFIDNYIKNSSGIYSQLMWEMCGYSSDGLEAQEQIKICKYEDIYNELFQTLIWYGLIEGTQDEFNTIVSTKPERVGSQGRLKDKCLYTEKQVEQVLGAEFHFVQRFYPEQLENTYKYGKIK